MTNKPSDFATVKSLEFIEANTELKGKTVLEVGAGKGELAVRLKERDASILALDISEENVEAARAKGVDAEVADFLSYEHTPFDVVLFTQSLHHIHPVNKAVENAQRLLKDSGIIIIEEFGANLVDEQTLHWLKTNLAARQRTDSEQQGKDRDHSHPAQEHKHASKTDSLQAWQNHHFQHHFISNSDKLLQTLSEYFDMTPPLMVPHMFRYLADVLTPNQAGFEAIAEIYKEEQQSIERGEIAAIGIRAVGRKRISK